MNYQQLIDDLIDKQFNLRFFEGNDKFEAIKNMLKQRYHKLIERIHNTLQNTTYINLREIKWLLSVNHTQHIPDYILHILYSYRFLLKKYRYTIHGLDILSSILNVEYDLETKNKLHLYVKTHSEHTIHDSKIYVDLHNDYVDAKQLYEMYKYVTDNYILLCNRFDAKTIIEIRFSLIRYLEINVSYVIDNDTIAYIFNAYTNHCINISTCNNS